MEMIKE
jgi:hypothetical protein